MSTRRGDGSTERLCSSDSAAATASGGQALVVDRLVSCGQSLGPATGHGS